jgi:hypothetical protein
MRLRRAGIRKRPDRSQIVNRGLKVFIEFQSSPSPKARCNRAQIQELDYEDRTVYFKYFLTHAENDKDKWKNDPYF